MFVTVPVDAVTRVVILSTLSPELIGSTESPLADKAVPGSPAAAPTVGIFKTKSDLVPHNKLYFPYVASVGICKSNNIFVSIP